MEIDIWRGEWGLPSIDVQCLQVMCYAKFSGAPLKLNATNNPLRTPTGSLPVLRHLDTTLTKFEEISAYFRKNNLSADYELSPRQCAEVVAYTQMVREKLAPALDYVWWVDGKNFVELSRPTYAKFLPFPLNFYYPGQYESRAKELVTCLYREEESMEVIETSVYKEAEECLTLLSTKLGDKEFFFGTSPCSLDAVVFAHLAPLLKAPLPSAALQNHLKACTNLNRFVGRILQRYFSKDIEEHGQPQKSSKKEEDPNVDLDFPNKKRNTILAALCAAVAMVGYGLLTGIIHVESIEEDYDE